jgi:hypothetical protein
MQLLTSPRNKIALNMEAACSSERYLFPILHIIANHNPDNRILNYRRLQNLKMQLAGTFMSTAPLYYTKSSSHAI